MTQASTGQVSKSAADIYEEFFVPALFAQWAPRLADAARIATGQRVLDVACGTGVLAREALRRVGPQGSVTGLDRNQGMLATAKRQQPGIAWQQGMAEALPFEASSFDVVMCQFGLMFFESRKKALQEMWRVLRRNGHLAVAVWDIAEHSPGYAAMIALLHRLFGKDIADELRAPFAMGDKATVQALFEEAGIRTADIQTVNGTARFPSIASWVATDVKGWTLADRIDEAQYRRLQDEAAIEFKRFVQSDDSVAFASPALIAVAVKP